MRLASRCGLTGLLVLVLLVASLPAGLPRATAQTAAPAASPVTDHPRLLLTAADLPGLRGWATAANPLWRDGLAPRAERAKADMDAGKVPGADTGSHYYEDYPTESYAELFAFMSLVHPDPAARADYARRARTLLMHVIAEAARGPAKDQPFRDPEFAGAASDRSRWWGEGFALTTDWIYPVLTAVDKAMIRQVFLRWATEIVTEGYHHAEPVGVVNDPALLADPVAVRWAGNNYVLAHMRNLGLMALALDPADDPGGELHAYLRIAVGANLYMVDHLFRTDAAGGLAPEGFEYSPQAVGYVAQFLLALHTAGQDDPAVWGRQVRFDANPFWDEVVPAYLNALSPRPVVVPGEEAMGLVYQPAWYGDGQNDWAPDMIGLFGALGRYDALAGNAQRLAAIRWIETETAPGGPGRLIARVADAEMHLDAILYFILIDPSAPRPPDPRPALPPYHFAPGIGRLSARTSWGADAAWFTYGLGWIAVDHQFGDGNQFEFYRHGEWLTKGLVGWGSEFGDADPTDDYYFPSSEYHNTLALQNAPPTYNDPGTATHELWRRGSQWEYDPAGDPTILALSVAPGYVYALGDATNLYNSPYEGPTDITQASRAIVWLAPDAIVVYDRAASRTAGRFKRFWLNLPAAATVSGNRTTMTTATGQQLVVTTLQPTDAAPHVQPLDVRVEDLAKGEPMRYRLLVEAPGGPKEARFLHVLQGADAGAAVPPATAIASDDGTFAGAVVGTTAVLFPVDAGGGRGELRYVVPAGTTAHVITGLVPGGGYDVATAPVAKGIAVRVTAGTAYRADAGGVLLVGSLPPALGASAFAFARSPRQAYVAATPLAAAPGTAGTVPAATAGAETAVPVDAASPVVEGGAAARGSGEVAYNVNGGHAYRVAARAGAAPEDISAALDAVAPAASRRATPGGTVAAPDAWVNVSSDGNWLALGTERFDPACAGWPCLAVVAGDLTAGEVVRAGGAVVHPAGFGAIAAGGRRIVYPNTGGPHQMDLWLVEKTGDGWAAPVLLTGTSPSRYNDQPAISADGSRIVFECGDQPYGAPGTALCEVGADGSGFHVLLSPAAAPAGLPRTGALRHPAYAPDGSVIFAADWDGTIWRLPAGAHTPAALGPAFANDNAPCALPDGRIASLWLDRPGGTSLHELKVMTPDGASYAMLATGVDIEDLGCGG